MKKVIVCSLILLIVVPLPPPEPRGFRESDKAHVDTTPSGMWHWLIESLKKRAKAIALMIAATMALISLDIVDRVSFTSHCDMEYASGTKAAKLQCSKRAELR